MKLPHAAAAAAILFGAGLALSQQYPFEGDARGEAHGAVPASVSQEGMDVPVTYDHIHPFEPRPPRPYALPLPRAMEGDAPIWDELPARALDPINLLPDVWFRGFRPGYAPQS